MLQTLAADTDNPRAPDTPATRAEPDTGAHDSTADELGRQPHVPRGTCAARPHSGSYSAFDAGRILRTHVLRPTWHFVLPEDIRWILELTAPRVHAFNAYYYRQQELDEPVFERCHALITDALAGGATLARKEIAAVLERGGVQAENLRLGLILMHAELDQLICSGPRRGKQHTYALLDERAPGGRRLTADEALAELTRRYFTSHAPATAKDFAWWSSLTMADVRRGLDMASPQLEEHVVGGVTYWHGPFEPYPRQPSPTVNLLQPYDEYTIAYAESRSVLDNAGFGSLRPQRGAYVGIVVRDTQFVGYWKRTVKNDDVIIDIQVHRPFDDMDMVALQSAADAHAAFLGKSAVVNQPQPLPGASATAAG